MSEQTEIRAPNIHPNPEYYIEREDEITRIENFIERTDGAVIGLTGVRGSGKSSVIEKIVKNAKDKGYFTLTISSPTGYDEKAFFRMVFSRLCEEVNKKIEEKFRIRTTLDKIAKTEINKNRTLLFLIFGIPLVILTLIGYFADQPVKDLSTLIKELIPVLTVYILYILLIPLFLLVIRISKEQKRAKRHPKMVGLYRLTQDILETLKYEKTTSYQAEAKVGFISQIAGVFKIGKELKTRPFTLPGLTSEYNDYISKVIETFEPVPQSETEQKRTESNALNPKRRKFFGSKRGTAPSGGKAIICIDELDKITDPEQVKKLLRGVKGVLFQKNCYYLISISEDAVKSFKTRFSAERDMLESTFDEIIDLDRINLDIAREIAKKRIGYKDEAEPPREVKKSIDMICVLSGGIPRELMRNLRQVSMNVEWKDISPIEAWKILFDKKIRDFKNEVKLASISEDIKTEIYEKIYEIADQVAPDNLFNMELNNTAEQEKKFIKEITKEIDDLQKSTLELKIYAVILEYLKKDESNGEEFLDRLLNAYSMLPYNKKLSDKNINTAISLLTVESSYQKNSKSP
jgi:ABC-type dipeptide/oligopeptide/nickel transport system ATPase subunit